MASPCQVRREKRQGSIIHLERASFQGQTPQRISASTRARDHRDTCRCPATDDAHPDSMAQRRGDRDRHRTTTHVGQPAVPATDASPGDQNCVRGNHRLACRLLECVRVWAETRQGVGAPGFVVRLVLRRSSDRAWLEFQRKEPFDKEMVRRSWFFRHRPCRGL
jgi:hypothetical protein